MDIITHSLSGVALASVCATVIQPKRLTSLFALFLGGLGGFMPDLDVITRWSGFDTTFGKWFNLGLSGNEIYWMKLWYSHHAFTHSLLAATLFTVLLALVIVLFNRFVFKSDRLSRKTMLLYLLSFFCGYCVHLFQDMITPGSTWGGIAFWWPSKVYIGGWGKVWWMNNYDLFLVPIVLIMVSALLNFLKSNGQIRRAVSVISLVLCIGFFAWQTNTRQYTYNNSTMKNHHQHESQSVEEQKRILGDDLYNIMHTFDSYVPFMF